MLVEKTEGEGNTVTLKVEIPWTDISERYENLVSRYRKKVSVPGFRQGKVPKDVILKRFSDEIKLDFAESVIGDYHAAAVQEAGVEPIDSGKIVEMDFGKEEPFVFKISMETTPDFELFDYGRERLKATKRVVSIGEEEVSVALEELQERYAEVSEIDGGADEGNFLEVDIQEVDDSLVPILGKKVEGRLIKLGEGEFGKQAEDQLKGARKGDERIVRIVNQHGDHTHTHNYSFKVNRVEEHILPELNDEFASKVDSSLKGLDELKDLATRNLEARLNRDENERVNRSLADEMVRMTELDVPDTLTESYLDVMVEEFKKDGDGEIDEEFVRKNYRATAIWNAKWSMIKRAIFRKENLTVSDGEIDAFLDDMAKYLRLDSKAAGSIKKDPAQREKVERDLRDIKVMEVLRANADINEEKISFAELRERESTIAE